ncbi:hypothetical protein HDU92_004668 [Lobulomyces angularis]|nr:hypothetical protein HDU92_004668 [Lobulomyces angularis]
MTLHDVVQANWENREFIQNVSISISELATCLTNFQKMCHESLGKMDSKLTQLERKLSTLEGSAAGHLVESEGEEGN